MKYEEIYKKIRDGIAVVSRKIENMQHADMPHKDWKKIDEIKSEIMYLRDHLYQFNKKLIEDGCTV